MREEILGIFPSFMNEDSGGITINNKAGTPVVGMGATNEDGGAISVFNKHGEVIGELP
jgi:hypothetical protein